jgi:hypothetical protein
MTTHVAGHEGVGRVVEGKSVVFALGDIPNIGYRLRKLTLSC